MSNILLREYPDKSNWNKLINSFPSASIFQTSNWADYQRNRFKKEPLFYVFEDRSDGRCISACLCCVDKKRLTVSWRFGPLIKNADNHAKDILELLFDALNERGIRYIKWSSLAFMLERSSYRDPIYTWGDFVIFLRQPEEAIWKEFHPSVRKNVNKCDHLGVSVRRLSSFKEVEKYYFPLLAEDRKRLGFGLPPDYPDINFWESFHNKDGCVCEIFLASRYGEPLAALPVIGFNKKITEIAIAQSKYCLAEKIPAPDLLKWEVIKWALAFGFEEFSLGGVADSPVNVKEEGIRRFKSKFGGKYITYSFISKILNRTQFYLFNFDRVVKEQVKDVLKGISRTRYFLQKNGIKHSSR